MNLSFRFNPTLSPSSQSGFKAPRTSGAFRPAQEDLGFTLIEVMISLVIMSFISLGIYQATVETYHVRDVIQAEGDFYNGIRMGVDVLARDIAAIYSPTLSSLKSSPSSQPVPPGSETPPTPTAPDPNDREWQELNAGEGGRSSLFWLPVMDKTGARPSRFNGTDRSLSFISASHVRVYQESPESVFAGLQYEALPDTDQPDIKDSMVLVRTLRTNVFDDENVLGKKEQPASLFPILRGIKKIKFRYWNKENSTWENTWDNEKTDLKNRFPDLIELSLEIEGPENLSFEGTYQLRPEAPLNGLDSSY